MKTILLATTLSLLVATQAVAEDKSASSTKDAIQVSPPITQTLGYSYSQPRILLKDKAPKTLVQDETKSDLLASLSDSTVKLGQ
jgi:hypothetical protein